MLVSLEIKALKSCFQMRYRSCVPILTVLALMFVIPHDPSSRLETWRYGGDAYAFRGRVGLPVHSVSGIAHQTRHTTPAMAATFGQAILGEAHTPILPRIVRCATHARGRELLLRRAAAAILDSLAIGIGDETASGSHAAWDDTNVTSLGWGASVEELRETFGERQRWYGDLSAAETRALYHSLLPTSLLETEGEHYSLEQRAHLAIAARRAARLYSRERALLPLAVGSELLDGLRQLLESGSFQVGGLTEDQIWRKYAGCTPSELADGDAFHEDVYYTVLRKACSSNRYIDSICGGGYSALNSAEAIDAATGAAHRAANAASDFGL